MFTIEYRINGALIGVIYGHNDGHDEIDHELYYYRYKFYEIDKGKITSGEISHRRENGLNKLIAEITHDIELRS